MWRARIHWRRWTAQVKKRRTLDAIKRIILRESLNQPLMMVFEDLHWIDDETQALLNLLADSIPNSKILMLVNYRPEYSHQWNSKTYYTQLRLDPLGKESAEEMLSALLGDGVEVRPLKRLIIERTEGNPFFMEETVLVLFDEGALVRNGAVKLTRSLNALKIPPTVQAILAARIDRQPANEKELLQTLAVMGMEFQLSLIRAVTARADDELNRMLSDLQLAEFIYEQPAVGDVEYRFKHALTREVAYNSVLTERRRTVHERIAQAIEQLFTNSLEDHLGELAHHYGHSGNRSKAVDYLTRAAAQASQRAAYSKAMQQYGRALEILHEMPPDRSRDARELNLQMGKGDTAYISEGVSSASVEAMTRAVELAVALDDIPRQAEALRILGDSHLVRGEMRRAAQLSRELHALAERHSELQPESIYQTGWVALRMGDFRKAEQHLGAAARMSASWRSLALVHMGDALWNLGFPDQALAVAKEALMLAERPDDPDQLMQVTTHFWAGYIHQNRGELAVAEGLFRKMRTLCAERGFSHLGEGATGAMLLVSALRGRSQYLGQMCQAIESSLASSATISPGARWALARAYAFDGKPDKALASLERALELAQGGGEEAELASMHLLKGNLLQGGSNSDGAEQSFRTSIEISRRQSAKSLELRATTALARLLRDTGRRDAARAMLAEIYNWFTEGFDTADLKDAKALLEELS